MSRDEIISGGDKTFLWQKLLFSFLGKNLRFLLLFFFGKSDENICEWRFYLV